MRILLSSVLALAALLGGCKREPTFEERYDTANRTIVDRAKRIDSQLAGKSGAPAPDKSSPAD